jgi:hypothetical protein
MATVFKYYVIVPPVEEEGGIAVALGWIRNY